MISIPGPLLKACNGISRRELLAAGALSAFGLSMPELIRAQAADAADGVLRPKTFGAAKSCLIVFLSGGCSHHDTFDMKPDAPAEIRGEFNPIATNVPGMTVCEHLPKLAKHFDKFRVVRSIAHKDNNHPSAVYEMITGHPYPRASNLSENLSRDDHPHIGCSLNAAERHRDAAVPSFVTVPDYIAVNGPVRAGQHSGFLGGKYDPLVARGNPNDAEYRPYDLGLVPQVPADRIAGRRNLLASVNAQVRYLEQAAAGKTVDAAYERAFGLLASGRTQRAFDINSEPDKMRDAYGRTLFGQSVLLGRRLVEAGVRLVHVNWIRILEQGWDTHNDNFNALRDKLLPPTDPALAALFADMTASGLLNETLVIVMGEFGRSPKITASNAGREHWAPANSILMAGAGIPGGRHYGATDKDGAYVTSGRITPADLAATVFHALGVDPKTHVTTKLERPWQICDGEPVTALWDS